MNHVWCYVLFSLFPPPLCPPPSSFLWCGVTDLQPSGGGAECENAQAQQPVVWPASGTGVGQFPWNQRRQPQAGDCLQAPAARGHPHHSQALPGPVPLEGPHRSHSGQHFIVTFSSPVPLQRIGSLQGCSQRGLVWSQHDFFLICLLNCWSFGNQT